MRRVSFLQQRTESYYQLGRPQTTDFCKYIGILLKHIIRFSTLPHAGKPGAYFPLAL